MHSSAKINDKYVAGFIDADGCIAIKVKKYKDIYYVQPCIHIAQKFRTTLDLIKEHFGWGYVSQDNRGYYIYQIDGKKAKTLLMRIVNHLVLKDAQAKWAINFDFSGPKTKEQVKQIKNSFKATRNLSDSKKQFPSRKWLAGYFDGDGCLSAHINKGIFRIMCTITAHRTDLKALELIQKNFKGSIAKVGNCYTWSLYIQPTSALKFLGYFGKHLQLKKSQYDAVMGYLKTRPHTSEEDEDFVNKLKIAKATGND